MKSRVHDHLVSLRERLWAVLTGVGPSVRVNPLVFSHQISPLETLGTVRTLVGPLAGVSNSASHGLVM